MEMYRTILAKIFSSLSPRPGMINSLLCMGRLSVPALDKDHPRPGVEKRHLYSEVSLAWLSVLECYVESTALQKLSEKG